jgi:hypothetical protein
MGRKRANDLIREKGLKKQKCGATARVQGRR